MEYNEKEYEILIEKAIEFTPIWLKQDIESIIQKKDETTRISYVISELYKKYTFNATHILAAMGQNTEWSVVSRERLNFIDNNIDLIQVILKRCE
ncbi:hypothetical protein [Peribacillus loiseleuriae]|uniref:Uncharacterized protein n=1 Tax=Peribacillus loiseleuriae TaxID=1679170 RepID=A0A0K9GU75_9BACI|nr:hypothetical protein [Peribacillus loiseleuriae]KMY50173.1 hypothetical protein AC625_12225 [Peribacillus loiseleuriae]